uniref:DH domain-containing protein n=1 Tax=Xiphophorus couchianus TaxID=32473 RepID=A0A3B5KUP7_9TELE
LQEGHMFEVLTSETSYLRSLYVLTEHFMENRELAETIIISERKTLFSNILKVREVSERFLKDLEEHIFKEIVFPDICNILHYHAQHNFSTYIDYVRNQTYQEKTFSRLMKTNEQFATVINRLQELPQCQRLPFISFLLLPFQRITRIKMLIEGMTQSNYWHHKGRTSVEILNISHDSKHTSNLVTKWLTDNNYSVLTRPSQSLISVLLKRAGQILI